MFSGSYLIRCLLDITSTIVLRAGGILRGRMWWLPAFRELTVKWISEEPRPPSKLTHEPRSFPVRFYIFLDPSELLLHSYFYLIWKEVITSIKWWMPGTDTFCNFRSY